MTEKNISAFLEQDEKKDLLRLLTAGSVDDGKSTLIGRLMFDSKQLYEDQLAALERDSKRIGHAGEEVDYALLLDGLKAEREQGITIDVAYRYFSTNKRKFIIADTPGHEQYTRNMVTGASTANLAIILVDASKGVITQTKRHTFLVSLLGIKHVILAVNKMDLIDYNKHKFDTIQKDYMDFIAPLDIPHVTCIPLSALKGENVVDKSDSMSWYKGKCILDFLESVHISSDRNFEDMRYPVQYVLKPDNDFRGFSTKVASGIIRKGEEVMVLPSQKKSKIKDIVTYDGSLDEAFPPQSVTVTLEDEIDISRGDMLVYPDNQPHVDRHFEAMLVWMDENPMDSTTHFFIKQANNTTKAHVDRIQYKVDVNTMEKSNIDFFSLNEIGQVVLTTNKPLFFDSYKKNKATGSFILIDPITNNTVAVGMIVDKLSNKYLPSCITDSERRQINNGKGLISTEQYQKQYNQKGVTLWVTGLFGSGKNECAYTLEKQLFEMGAKVVLLDGGTLRSGLSKELDFSPSNRTEHLRRIAEMCRILNDQGIIAICSFVSHEESVRKQVEDIIGKERFHTFYMKAELDYCKRNKAEFYNQKNIKFVPGIDLPFDEPTNHAITLTPAENSKSVEKIISFCNEKGIFPIQ
ncbi:MAG: sulfate adenylyltransferase subunit CysN [Mangrovibacterium sp.]